MEQPGWYFTAPWTPVAIRRGDALGFRASAEYFADLLVEDALMVELKAVRSLDDAHRMQCANYLKATGMHLCLLLNFGKPRLEMKRVVRDL